MARSAYLDWLARTFVGRPAASDPLSQPDTDLVLGYATGYGAAEIAPFVRSLRAHHQGAVALVVDPRPDVAALLKACGVEAIPTRESLGTWTPHPVVARFAAYAAVLEARPWLRNIILTDVRDVIFQADPFAAPMEQLEFYEENEGRPLAAHAFNTKHLRALAGEALAQSVMDRSCVCVGVVTGPRLEALRFCRTLLTLCAIPRSNVGGSFGADQAACNLIAHLGLSGGAVRRNYGRVATIGLTQAGRLRLQDDRILNPDGEFSPIVHQYDRTAVLRQFVERHWGVSPPPPLPPVRRLHRRASVLRQSVRRRMPELR